MPLFCLNQKNFTLKNRMKTEKMEILFGRISVIKAYFLKCLFCKKSTTFFLFTAFIGLFSEKEENSYETNH